MARLNIGFAHLQKAELDQAAAEFRAVLERDPNSAVAHYDLGVALKQKDDLDGARAELSRAIALDPQLAEAHYTLGIVHWQSGRFRRGRARDAGGASRSRRSTPRRSSCWGRR